MKITVAVLDACVLYPPALRDLFMWLAVDRVYQPRWTNQIHDEWMRNVRANRPEISHAQLERTRQLMDGINDETLVTGYETLIPSLTLPDVDDRHVFAAAIKAKATLIVTFNLSDFPNQTLKQFGIRSVHPDIFLCDLFDDEPTLFIHGLSLHRSSLKNPPKTSEQYLETLNTNGLKKLVLKIKPLIDSI